MRDYKTFFAGKRVTLMGLGLLGRGTGDARFLAECGAELTITDLKSEDQLKESLVQLANFKNITYSLGGHQLADFKDCDLVIKAAGVPLDSPFVAEAKKNGIPVYMSTALFAKFAMELFVRVVGVTGTRGKTTVTSLIYHALKKAGRPVHLGGNIRGLSTLALLPDIQSGDIAVLELDSWQLQGFGDLKISPNISVFTNLMPDHLNYYHGDIEKYFSDKANIFRYQKHGDLLIAGASVVDRIRIMNPPVTPVVPEIALGSMLHLQILGQHNIENASLAAAALIPLGLSNTEIKDGLEAFEGVPGRLEFLGEKQGVKIYNDNNATTPDATVAAIKALDEGKKNIILIMGGADKGLDMSRLVATCRDACKGLVLLAGTGTERIRSDFPQAQVYENLSAALGEVRQMATEGDTILFSPAFASFGLFKNEYDRNDQFKKAVAAL